MYYEVYVWFNKTYKVWTLEVIGHANLNYAHSSILKVLQYYERLKKQIAA